MVRVIWIRLISLLVILAPLIHIGGGDNAYIASARIKLPELLGLISQTTLYLFYICSIFIMVSLSRKKGVILTRINRFFLLSYIVVFIMSLVQFEDISRYFLLVVIFYAIPFIVYEVYESGKFEYLNSSIGFCSRFYILASFIICIINYNPALRFNGLVGNPNIFSATIFSCLVIHLFSEYIKGKKKNSTIDIITIFSLIMIIFSGSRSAMLAIIFLLLLQVKSIKSGFLIILVSSVVIFCIEQYSSGFVTQRFNSIGDGYIAASEASGRSEIWLKAIHLIEKEPLTGAGMSGALEAIGSNNIHNSYLRVLVTTGVPLGGLAILFFLLGTTNIVFSNVPNEIKAYFLMVLVFFSGEDFIVGIGSAFIFYLVLILSMTQVIYLRGNHEN